MRVKAYAKLNLTLNVLGVKEGFHLIDSIATSVDVFDLVEVVRRSDKRVSVSGCPDIQDEQNTAYNTACAFVRQFGCCGVDIAITKQIPFGAGMGGSSADATAVVYCMSKLFDVGLDSPAIYSLCALMGSDLNFMLHGGLGRLYGKGDDVVFGKLRSPLYFALTTFDTAMSTAEVYSHFDQIAPERVYVDNGALFKIMQSGKVRSVTECFNNHLKASTASLSAYAQRYLDFCSGNGLTPNMTGSGSAYYVAFVDEQKATDATALLNARGFKTIACKSVPCGIEEI